MEKIPQQAAFTAVLKTFSKKKIMVDTREDGIYIRLAGRPEDGFVFSLDWWKVFDFGKRSNTASYAQIELDILVKSSTDPNDRPIIEPFIPEILALCERFGLSGQSGGSAPYTASAITQVIKKLLLQKPIMPITGIDEEWVDVARYADKSETECIWQNARCSNLFKNSKGQAWFLDAIGWKEDYGGCYFGSACLPNGEVFYSRQLVKYFPFIPKTFYIDVVKEILPADWAQEPFTEWDYYDTKEFEETGEQVWKTEKYRNIIKDPSQLNRVFKYYDKYDFL